MFYLGIQCFVNIKTLNISEREDYYWLIHKHLFENFLNNKIKNEFEKKTKNSFSYVHNLQSI
jgi:hypothetical protein